MTIIKEGPVLAVRFSLDGKLLAVQRTNQEIEFFNKESCTGFKQQCRSSSDRILGFFWTDCPACDIVFVTTRYTRIPQCFQATPHLHDVTLAGSCCNSQSIIIYSVSVLVVHSCRASAFPQYLFCGPIRVGQRVRDVHPVPE